MYLRRILVSVFLLLLLNQSLVVGQTWESIGPHTGEVQDLYFSPHGPDIVYAYGNLSPDYGGDGQLMVSLDAGSSFSYVMNRRDVVGMAFHPTSPDTAWILGENAYSRTTNNGFTWEDFQFPAGRSWMSGLARAPGEDGPLYFVATNDYSSELFRSLDEGDSWVMTYSDYSGGVANVNGLFFRPVNADTLYTVRQTPYSLEPGSDLWRSVDDGETWECMSSPHPTITHWIMVPEVYFHPDDPSLVYGIGEVFQGQFGLFSDDGGRSFNLLLGPWGGSENVRPMVAANGDILVITPEDIYISTDVGQTFTSIIVNPQQFPTHLYDDVNTDDLTLTPYSSERIYLKYRDVFMFSLDSGETWVTSADGFHGSTVRSVWATLADPDVVHAKTSGGIFRTEDRGETWTVLDIGIATNLSVSPYNADQCMRWSYSTPWLSLDGGETWVEQVGLGNLEDFAFHPSSTDTIMCLANPPGLISGIYRTTDGGASWNRTDGFDSFWGDMEYDPLNPNRVTITSRTYNFFESLDGGESFDQVDMGEDLFDFSIQPDGTGAVGIAIRNDELIGVRTQDRSILGFTSEFELPEELPFIEYATGGKIISYGLLEVYVSPDNGESWQLIFEPEEILTPPSPLAVTSDGTVYVAGENAGVLMSYDALGVDNSDVSIALPSEFSLLPVYPNPFNGTTTIPFSLSFATQASITVFDVLGRTVADLANDQVFGAGIQRITWTADGLASGTYFVRVELVNESANTRHVVLLK